MSRTNQDDLREQALPGRQDDAEVRQSLYESYHRGLHTLTVRLVGVQDAEDVLQQVFLRTFENIDQFAGRSSFKTWLYRVAMNEALQHLRKRQHRTHQPLDREPPDRSTGQEQSVAQKELMEKALSRLDPELRSILLLKEIDAMSYDEIAEVLQIPQGTVGSRLNRARRELRTHLIYLGWEV